MEYGNIPQNRERIYIVGFKGESGYWSELEGSSVNICSSNFKFPDPVKLTVKVRDILEESPKDKYYYTEKSRYYKEFMSFNWSETTVYQWRRVYLRQNKSNVCPTLTANMGMGGHNVPLIKDKKGIRKLTQRECARLQGFPDSFILPTIADSQIYKQIGNSVTVPVITRIAENIKFALDAKYRLQLRKDKIETKEFQLMLVREKRSRYSSSRATHRRRKH